MFWSITINLLPALVGFCVLIGIAAFKSLVSRIGIFTKIPAHVPPGRMGWPLLGETLGFLRPHKSNSIGNFLQEHRSRYGTVFKSHLFGTPTIVSCDLELNAFVLQNEGRLFGSSYPKPVRDILGKLCLMLVGGDLHKRLRSVVLNFINASKSRPDFLLYIEHLSAAMMDSWKHTPQILFFKEAKKFTFYVMLKNLLDMERGEKQSSELLEDFLTFMKGFVSLPVHLPGSSYAKAMKARRRISSTLRGILSERQKSLKGNPNREFLEEIMEKGKLSDEERVSIVLDLLLAGYETTSGLMALVVYFLAQSPSSLQKLKEEHQMLRNKKGGKPLNLEDYKQMVFTNKVISETMRCGNLVKFVHRKALKDIKYKDFLIPSGWQVLPIFSATHLDPSLHENPSEFNPSRWDDEATSRKVTPFGGGLRLCPGAEIARIETAFFLHHLVLKYRWKIREDESPMSYPFLEFNRGLLLDVEPLTSG